MHCVEIVTNEACLLVAERVPEIVGFGYPQLHFEKSSNVAKMKKILVQLAFNPFFG